MAFDWRNIFGGSLMNTAPVDYTAGGTIGNPTAGIGDRGYINPMGQVEQTSPTGRPLRPSVGMGIDPYGKSWFDKLDPQALEDVAGLASPQRQQGKVLPAPGISRGGKQGGGGRIPLSQPSEYTFAPNPGFGLVLSSREKDRFSGTS